VELLIAVVNDVDRVDEILAGFLEIGVTGATVIDSEGMGKVLSQEIPVFAGLQSLISRSRPRNQTIFSVIDDPARMDNALKIIQEVCGRFDDPATGIAVTVPVSRVVGLAPELTEPGG
jgi:nitrogen regulatory protein P-II 1